MSTAEKFDLIVLGGGKGGKSLAMAMGPAGQKVALIERGQIGGTCINVACIPTKTMVASAKLAEMANRAEHFGIVLPKPGNSIASVIERKRRIVKGMVDQHWKLFTATPGMELILGTGKFLSSTEIEVTGEAGARRVLTADRIVVNTGSKTLIPEIPGLETVPYLTSTSIMEIDTLPEHLAIVGGGYIALEFAQIFARLGSRVTVLLRGKQFLPREDSDIAEAVFKVLEDEGVTFKFNTEIESVKQVDTGIAIECSGGADTEVECSHLMLAIGRVPNTANLDLAAAGINSDAQGNIVVNERLETSAAGIWAIGDCKGGPLFTHASWDDFRILKHNFLNGGKRTTTDRLMPYTLFIDPELGRVGLTEAQARKSGLDILVAKIPASKIPRANTSGETRGLLKAVLDNNSGQILGCSLLCHSAGEVMSVVQMAMLGKVPYKEVRDTIFTHPTMAEALNILFASVE